MENRSDYEKRMGEKLEAAYMLEDIEPVMSREEFHRLIKAAEKKKKRRKTLLGLVAASVALCLVCSGFVVGMTMGESASAGKDDETKTVQQGDSVIIGSGVSENDRNVGVTTKTYTDIEDIPEDIREEICFLSSDEFKLDKVKVTTGEKVKTYVLNYLDIEGNLIVINVEKNVQDTPSSYVIKNPDNVKEFKGVSVYEKRETGGLWYVFRHEKTLSSIYVPQEAVNKKEAILEGLI